MPSIQDGPSSPQFAPLALKGQVASLEMAGQDFSDDMAGATEQAPSGDCVAWGIRFEIGDVVALRDRVVSVDFTPTLAPWLVFVHTSDAQPVGPDADGFISPMTGEGQLAEHAADYVMLYEDGTEESTPIRRRHQIGAFRRRWGENCFEAVAHRKPHPVRASHEQLIAGWGRSQTRVAQLDGSHGEPWTNWLWAWHNPYPDKAIAGLRFEPVSGLTIVSAVSAGNASSHPLRWMARRKAIFKLALSETFLPKLDERGLLEQIQLDMGQVISATPRLV